VPRAEAPARWRDGEVAWFLAWCGVCRRLVPPAEGWFAEEGVDAYEHEHPLSLIGLVEEGGVRALVLAGDPPPRLAELAERLWLKERRGLDEASLALAEAAAEEERRGRATAV
jgi:hypothetical protein